MGCGAKRLILCSISCKKDPWWYEPESKRKVLSNLYKLNEKDPRGAWRVGNLLQLMFPNAIGKPESELTDLLIQNRQALIFFWGDFDLIALYDSQEHSNLMGLGNCKPHNVIAFINITNPEQYTAIRTFRGLYDEEHNNPYIITLGPYFELPPIVSTFPSSPS